MRKKFSQFITGFWDLAISREHVKIHVLHIFLRNNSFKYSNSYSSFAAFHKGFISLS